MFLNDGIRRVERNKLKVLYRRIDIEDMGEGFRWIIEVENEFPSDNRRTDDYDVPSVNSCDKEMYLIFRRLIIEERKIVLY